MRVSVLLFATLASIPAIALAGEKKADNKDPNRIICEKQEVLGSRVATKKVCLTAAQWEDRRREDREAIEKGQKQARGPSGS
jgi:predicted ATP-grasp superfamily ATP-dependent carboligase